MPSYHKIAVNGAKHALGKHGETIACQYLQGKGFVIRDINVFSRWGELDIVAIKDDKIHFIEVKTRINIHQGMPYEGVHITKMRHLMRSIKHYILSRKLDKYKFQLDVIAIVLNRDQTVNDLRCYENLQVDRFF